METPEILKLMHDSYGLIVVLRDIILNLDDSKLNKREFTGLIALVEAIEQNIYNVKSGLEYSCTLEK